MNVEIEEPYAGSPAAELAISGTLGELAKLSGLSLLVFTPGTRAPASRASARSQRRGRYDARTGPRVGQSSLIGSGLSLFLFLGPVVLSGSLYLELVLEPGNGSLC